MESTREERGMQNPRLRARLEQEKRFDEVEKRLARAYAHLRMDALDRALAQHSEPGRIPEAEELARCFHETYECLAPQYGYETRKETRKFDSDSKNGRLMIAVCRVIRERFAAPALDADEGEDGL